MVIHQKLDKLKNHFCTLSFNSINMLLKRLCYTMVSTIFNLKTQWTDTEK